jgi:hypothetical protein
MIVGTAAASVGDDKFRIELDRLFVVGDCAVPLALLLIAEAAVGVGASIFRIEDDRLIEVGNRTVVLALAPFVGIPAAVIGVGVFRISRQQTAARGDAVIAARLPARIGVVSQGRRQRSTQGQQRRAARKTRMKFISDAPAIASW